MTFINPFRPSLCPFCFKQFYLADCDIVSAKTGAILAGPPRGLNHALARVWIKPLAGSQATELACRRCPHCGELLPHNIEYMDNRIIGLVGGTGSGKSHYIASLINSLERGGAQGVGCTRFSPLNQQVEARYLNTYYRPLFEMKVEIPRTPQVVLPQDRLKPLVYVMLFRTKSRLRPYKRVNLVLFDAAGEDIRNEDALVLHSRYILNASALIFLVDPTTMPGLSQQLPSYLRLNVPTENEAFRVFNRVIDTFERYRGLKPGDPLPVPAAITVAKSDLLKYVLGHLGQDSCVMQDSSYQNGFKLNEFQAVNDEVHELMTRLEGSIVTQIESTFANACFAAVSATGCPSDANGQFPMIAPRRCLDPLLWALWKLGILEDS